MRTGARCSILIGRSGSSGTGVGQNSLNQSTQTFTTALVLQAAIAAGEIAAFAIIFKRFRKVYEPRTFLPKPGYAAALATGADSAATAPIRCPSRSGAGSQRSLMPTLGRSSHATASMPVCRCSSPLAYGHRHVPQSSSADPWLQLTPQFLSLQLWFFGPVTIVSVRRYVPVCSS